jgi:hypothetical protein
MFVSYRIVPVLSEEEDYKEIGFSFFFGFPKKRQRLNGVSSQAHNTKQNGRKVALVAVDWITGPHKNGNAFNS